MEPSCSHREFETGCPECINTRENKVDDIEVNIINAYKFGGFRGITHYVLELLNVPKKEIRPTYETHMVIEIAEYKRLLKENEELRRK